MYSSELVDFHVLDLRCMTKVEYFDPIVFMDNDL